MRDPGKSPRTNLGPKKIPKRMGVMMTKAPGAIISWMDDLVEILIQAW